MNGMDAKELLGRLDGPTYLRLTEVRRQEIWRQLRGAAAEGLDLDAVGGLAAAPRVRGQLVLAGAPEAYGRFAARELGANVHAGLADATWRAEADDGSTSPGLWLGVAGDLDCPGEPLFRADGDRVLLSVPEVPDLAGGLDVTTEGPSGTADIVLRRAADSDPQSGEPDEHVLPGRSELSYAAIEAGHPARRLVFRATGWLDLGAPWLPAGSWELFVRVQSCGWSKQARLDGRTLDPPWTAVLPGRSGPRFVGIRGGAGPGLWIDVDGPSGRLLAGRSLMRSDARLERVAGKLAVSVDLPFCSLSGPATHQLPLVLEPRPVGRALRLPGVLTCAPGHPAVLTAYAQEELLHRPGRYRLAVSAPGGDCALGLDLIVDADGQARVGHPPKVSVLVPPGAPHLQSRLVPALEQQSMPAEEFELVERLDQVRGDHVLLADPADLPAPDALERLHAYADHTEAEIVLGRSSIADETYQCSRDQVDRTELPLLAQQSGTALYRTDLLQQLPGGLCAPAFTVLAQLRATRTAVLADRLCFRRVGEPAAAEGAPAVADLIASLDLLEEHVEPGELRQRVLAHWLRHELLDRVRGRRLLALRPGSRRAFLEAARAVVDDRFPLELFDELPPLPRIAATLLAEGLFADLSRLAEWEAGCNVVIEHTRPSWDAGVLRIYAQVRLDTGELLDNDGRLVPDLPLSAPATQAIGRIDVHDAVADTTADLVLAAEDEGGYVVPGQVRAMLTPLAKGPGRRWTSEYDIDFEFTPTDAAAGDPLAPGVWHLLIRLDCLGVRRETRLVARSADLPVGSERASRPASRLPGSRLPLALVVGTGRPPELERVPVPLVRQRRRLGRSLHRLFGW